jgi:hypothetical protein
MNETIFKNKIIQQFKTDNHYIFKYPAGIRGAGVPDLVACIYGKFYGLEAKVVKIPVRNDTLIYPFKELTQLQFSNLYQIIHAGGEGIVLTLIDPDKIVVILNVLSFLMDQARKEMKFSDYKIPSFQEKYEKIKNFNFSKEKILFLAKNSIYYKEGENRSKKITELIQEQKCLSTTKLTSRL